VALDGHFALELDVGYKAHEEHLLRTDNPHLPNAIAWDKGWVRRAREQEATTVAKTKVVGFREWIWMQGRSERPTHSE
jgi:hypothetical protein